MRKAIVIPTYWSRALHSGEGWVEGDAVYDHPTPIDGEDTLSLTLESMKILDNRDYILVILLCPTTEKILTQARQRVLEILDKANLGVQTYVFTPSQLNSIKYIAYEKELKQESTDLLSLYGYANVRNMCIYIAYILGVDVAMLIDDDEIFEKSNFIDIATEFIGGRLYGKTVDGIAGYYLNKYNNYYDDVNIEPWMTYWDRFGSKAAAFDKIIGSEPRIKPTPFAFGGAMVIHRNLFKTVPFDPRITRGEDIDYLINAKMFGFHFFLDRELSIKHLPPPKSHPVWKRFREDIYRFMYEKKKIDTQYEVPNMNIVSPEEFDPYPGSFLKDELEDMIFKANVMLSMDYLASNDFESARESIKNIYLSKYEATPKDDVFTHLRKVQRYWRRLLDFTKDNMMQIRKIMDECDTGCTLEIRKGEHMQHMTSEEVESLLAQMEPFSAMEPKYRDILAGIARINVYETDEFILRTGDTADAFYIINEGAVRISRFNYADEEIILGRLVKGDFFGESTIISADINVNIIAEETTQIISFSEEEIMNIINSYPKAGVKVVMVFLKNMAHKLSSLNSRYMDAISKNLEIEMKDIKW
ncbi:hypothetical protein EAL2_c01060 [Peptoclostridium acidaminophilum DSM 3953]|uniref:Cyclic nucleotide-binding domain-containing protein n=1 Tax=Peptoclostridium acidaminophilum DSM 3953 TaxID=1286171 RepID=W8TCB0_PEPAC|nr:cyclic nucleotide-binding domain-containing protein [Peptoclostridium acidaminophilum]AHM55443.1 hypothetical protein EAL2_c01060 [Peptoclostridium acidaminophilum DSM 3953]